MITHIEPNGCTFEVEYEIEPGMPSYLGDIEVYEADSISIKTLMWKGGDITEVMDAWDLRGTIELIIAANMESEE